MTGGIASFYSILGLLCASKTTDFVIKYVGTEFLKSAQYKVYYIIWHAENIFCHFMYFAERNMIHVSLLFREDARIL